MGAVSSMDIRGWLAWAPYPKMEPRSRPVDKAACSGDRRGLTAPTEPPRWAVGMGIGLRPGAEPAHTQST